MNESRNALAGQIAQIAWLELRPHLQRDALLVIGEDLDLATAAAAVAGDDTSAVRLWLDQGAIGKPSTAQLAAWEDDPRKPFRFLIVQPYVLIQEIPAPAGEGALP